MVGLYESEWLSELALENSLSASEWFYEFTSSNEEFNIKLESDVAYVYLTIDKEGLKDNVSNVIKNFVSQTNNNLKMQDFETENIGVVSFSKKEVFGLGSKSLKILDVEDSYVASEVRDFFIYSLKNNLIKE